MASARGLTLQTDPALISAHSQAAHSAFDAADDYFQNGQLYPTGGNGSGGAPLRALYRVQSAGGSEYYSQPRTPSPSSSLLVLANTHGHYMEAATAPPVPHTSQSRHGSFYGGGGGGVGERETPVAADWQRRVPRQSDQWVYPQFTAGLPQGYSYSAPHISAPPPGAGRAYPRDSHVRDPSAFGHQPAYGFHQPQTYHEAHYSPAGFGSPTQAPVWPPDYSYHRSTAPEPMHPYVAPTPVSVPPPPAPTPTPTPPSPTPLQLPIGSEAAIAVAAAAAAAAGGATLSASALARSMGLEQYAQTLEANDVTVAVICGLSDEDFETMGIRCAYSGRVIEAPCGDWRTATDSFRADE